MVAIAKQVGPSRWRESFGRYYEDFQPGDVYEHRPGRTISEADNTWFTLLTMNTHPLHFDAAYAAKSEFGRPLVNSCLTLSIVVGMSVSDISQKAIGRGAGEARVGQTSDTRGRDRPHYRPQGGRHGVHHFRAHRPRAEARPRRG